MLEGCLVVRDIEVKIKRPARLPIDGDRLRLERSPVRTVIGTFDNPCRRSAENAHTLVIPFEDIAPKTDLPHGISTDIIGASIRAYVGAVNKIVYEEK